MRLFARFSVILFLALPGLVRADEPSYRIYADFEYVYLERDKTNNVDAGFIDVAPTVPGGRFEVLKSDDVVDEPVMGGRAAIGYRLDRRNAIEVVAMGFRGDDDKTVRSPDGDLEPLFSDVWVGAPAAASGSTIGAANSDFQSAEQYRLKFDMEFYDGQINYRRHLTDGRAALVALVGLRGARLEEDLDFFSLDTLGSGPFVRGGGELAVYAIETRNTLAGGQVGLDGVLLLWRDVIALDLFGAAGAYANQTSVITEYVEDSVPGGIRQRRTEWSPAGMFEAAAHLKVRLTRNLGLSLGYRALFLMNIATAPDQFMRSAADSDFFGNSFDDDGRTLFHGGSVQLNLRF